MYMPKTNKVKYKTSGAVDSAELRTPIMRKRDGKGKKGLKYSSTQDSEDHEQVAVPRKVVRSRTTAIKVSVPQKEKPIRQVRLPDLPHYEDLEPNQVIKDRVNKLRKQQYRKDREL